MQTVQTFAFHRHVQMAHPQFLFPTIIFFPDEIFGIHFYCMAKKDILGTFLERNDSLYWLKLWYTKPPYVFLKIALCASDFLSDVDSRCQGNNAEEI